MQLRQEHQAPQELKPMHSWTRLDSVAQSIELNRPNLHTVAAPDRTVTIMFFKHRRLRRCSPSNSGTSGGSSCCTATTLSSVVI